MVQYGSMGDIAKQKSVINPCNIKSPFPSAALQHSESYHCHKGKKAQITCVTDGISC
jgi:hypothetical protein